MPTVFQTSEALGDWLTLHSTLFCHSQCVRPNEKWHGTSWPVPTTALVCSHLLLLYSSLNDFIHSFMWVSHYHLLVLSSWGQNLELSPKFEINYQGKKIRTKGYGEWDSPPPSPSVIWMSSPELARHFFLKTFLHQAQCWNYVFLPLILSRLLKPGAPSFPRPLAPLTPFQLPTSPSPGPWTAHWSCCSSFPPGPCPGPAHSIPSAQRVLINFTEPHWLRSHYSLYWPLSRLILLSEH